MACRRRIAFFSGKTGSDAGRDAYFWRNAQSPAAARLFPGKIVSSRRHDTCFALRATCCRCRDSLFFRKSRPASGTTRLIFGIRDLPATRLVFPGKHGFYRWQKARDGRMADSAVPKNEDPSIFRGSPAAQADNPATIECCQRHDTSTPRTIRGATGTARFSNKEQLLQPAEHLRAAKETFPLGEMAKAPEIDTCRFEIRLFSQKEPVAHDAPSARATNDASPGWQDPLFGRIKSRAAASSGFPSGKAFVPFRNRAN